MPYNADEFEIIQVPIPKGSSVLAHLREEACKYRGHSYVGPHIATLLIDRDAHIYGEAEGNGKGIWFPSTHTVLAPTLPLVVPSPPVIIEDATVEKRKALARGIVASFGADDDFDEE